MTHSPEIKQNFNEKEKRLLSGSEIFYLFVLIFIS